MRCVLFACVFILASLIKQTAYAQDPGELIKGLFSRIIERVGEKAIDNVTKQMDSNSQTPVESVQPLQTQPEVTSVPLGWCQVWNGSQMVDQEPCQTSQRCKSSGICYTTFVWPSGAKTVWEMDGQRPLKINGNATSVVQVAGTNCLYNSKSRNSFCYTKEPQLGELVRANPVEVTLTPASQPTLEAPVVESVEPAAQPSAYDQLVDQYITAAGDENSTTERRCAIATEIVTNHDTELTGEMLELLTNQMEVDGCFG